MVFSKLIKITDLINKTISYKNINSTIIQYIRQGHPDSPIMYNTDSSYRHNNDSSYRHNLFNVVHEDGLYIIKLDYDIYEICERTTHRLSSIENNEIVSLRHILRYERMNLG